jgi:hypothetical protein
MQAIIIHQKITDQGINIPIDKLKEFEDREVEIIILPASNQSASPRAAFMSFAGRLPVGEADAMIKDTADCRIIEEDAWK